jgi:hypothetical protein
MNKKLEPPKKSLGEVRIKKDTVPGNLIPIEDLDYLIDNLIQNKKKKSNNTNSISVDNNTVTSTQNSTSVKANSTNTKNNSSNKSGMDSKVTSVPETKIDIENNKKTKDDKNTTKKDGKDNSIKNNPSDNNNNTNDKKRSNVKEDAPDKNTKKVKVEEKKTETKKPKRKKVFQACVVCRKSHISCDNKRPCTRCVKKGIAHLCHDAPKKGSNMMDCNSCPIFPLLKGPHPFQNNFYKPPPYPTYSSSILNSQLNPSPLTNFPIPLLNHQKLNYPPPQSPYPGINANNGLIQQQAQLLQKSGQQLNPSPQNLQSSLQTLKQTIQNQQQNVQSPHTATPSPSLSQQLTPPLTNPLTNLNTMTSNAVNNPTITSTFPLTTTNVNSITNANALTLPLSTNSMTNVNLVQQQQPTSSHSSTQGSIHTSPLVTLPATMMPPNVTVSSTLQNTIQALQSTQALTSPIVNNSQPISSQNLPSSAAALNTSEMNSISTLNTNTTEENLANNITSLLSSVNSPHYALPNLEFNPSKPCVPFSSVTPIFSSDYMNNEFSALVNFCQNVSHENDMPSRCKNCPFSRTEQFFLKAADNSNPNVSIEDQLIDIIKEKYKAGLLKPYNYSKGYLRLQKFLDENISIVNKQKILNAFNTFQKGFKNAATGVTDWDLLSSEESFERLLLEYDRVFASVGIPSCLWRRTGEIFKANRHFAYLVGVPVEELNGGKMSIYEFMTEDFVANYWEKYSLIAFDTKQKAVITSCVLENPQSFKRSVKCAFSFTVRRDKFDIPSAIIGNFMPYNPQLIYKDPFSTSGLGILGFLSPYSTPSYSPLPRGETGYKGCGCTNTQCCSDLKKEIKPKATTTTSGGYYGHDHDYDYDHDHDHSHDHYHHDYDHDHDHNHNHDHFHDYNNSNSSNSNNNSNNYSNNNNINNNSNNNNNSSNSNYNNYNNSYTRKGASATKSNSYSKIKSYSINNDTNTCPRDTQGNLLCSQCNINTNCSRKLTTISCDDHSCSCNNNCECNCEMKNIGNLSYNNNNLINKSVTTKVETVVTKAETETVRTAATNVQNSMNISSNASSTMQDSQSIINDPVMNEFMNIDMGSIYSTHSNHTTPVTTTATTTINIAMNNTSTNNNSNSNSNNNKVNNTNLNTNSTKSTSTMTNSRKNSINSSSSSSSDKNTMNKNLQHLSTENTLNSFLNFSSSSLNKLHNGNIINNLKNSVPLMNTNVASSTNLNSSFTKEQLHRLQQILKQKIMNQNKVNNLPHLPVNDIRNELSEDLLLSILNAE